MPLVRNESPSIQERNIEGGEIGDAFSQIPPNHSHSVDVLERSQKL